MLAALVSFAIRFRGVVLSLALLLLGYGVYALSHAGLDIFPEFSPKLVIVQTEASGLTAEQVETLVTQPIENSLSGLIGMDYIRSESISGLSIVTVIFKEHTDRYLNRQQVTERLAPLAGQLPPGIGAPVAVPLASSSATIMTLGVTADTPDLMAVRQAADYTIVPRILSVPGVADVNVFGGHTREVQIHVHPERLRRYGIGMDEVVAAARQASGQTGSGFIENENQRITLRQVGLPRTPAEIGAVVLVHGATGSVRLADVADVNYGPMPPIGAASVNGKDGVVMMVIGQFGANTLTVSRAVRDELAELQTTLQTQGIHLDPTLFQPANYIETSVHNLFGHLLVGGGFVIMVLVLFLFNLRTALISIAAIPLSLVAAALVLLLAGVNLNVMVLGGLAIALGEVVDDAIIDTENIFRRLRQNLALAQPRNVADVVFDASMEVRGSVVYASFIVAIVFVPLLTLGGVAGRLFSPLGISYILAILMSLLVALMVTPAMCYWLLGHASLPQRDPPLVRLLKPLYALLLKLLARLPNLILLLSLLLCVISILLFRALPTRFLPELREGHYIVHTNAMPGTALAETMRIGDGLTARFLQVPGVRSVSQWAGRAERSADTFGSHYAEYEVDLHPLAGHEQQRVLETLREILASVPGLLPEVNTFLTERVDETVSGYTAPVVVNIYGRDLETLDGKARHIAALMSSLAGASEVQVRSPAGVPQLQVRLKLNALATWGLRPLQVQEVMQAAFEGLVVGRVYEGNQTYNVSVLLNEEGRDDPADVAHMPIETPSGAMITLADVADIKQVNGRYNVLHRNAQRVQTVTANIVGRDYDDFMHELRARVLAQVAFDTQTYPEFTGSAVEQTLAKRELILHSLFAGFGVLVFIYLAIGSFRHMLLMLLNVPFSLVGGVLAAVLTGASLSVGSMVGFVTLFGITVRNSIMLVSHYQHLVAEEKRAWNLHAMILGAQERLPSIVMTALVTALAMLPIAVDSDNAGREIMGPMAAIIIGGLFSSTVLNLLVLPVVLLRYGRFTTTRQRVARTPRPAGEGAAHSAAGEGAM